MQLSARSSSPASILKMPETITSCDSTNSSGRAASRGVHTNKRRYVSIRERSTSSEIAQEMPAPYEGGDTFTTEKGYSSGTSTPTSPACAVLSKNYLGTVIDYPTYLLDHIFERGLSFVRVILWLDDFRVPSGSR